jgi:NAD(P)H dehydrogenase (quinone)
MKTLVIYSHPNPKSFNHAILEQLCKGLEENDVEYEVVDLNKIGFNPVLGMQDFILFGEGKVPSDVMEQQEKVKEANHIVFVHPTWWGGMPSILKGYLDRVFTIGFAYNMGAAQPEGLMTGKNVTFIRTTALPEVLYKESGVEELIRNMLRFQFIVVCGFNDIQHKVYYAVSGVSEEVRKEYLKDVDELSKNL